VLIAIQTIKNHLLITLKTATCNGALINAFLVMTAGVDVILEPVTSQENAKPNVMIIGVMIIAKAAVME
jgi:hypothetical protein